jgi:hypothetical protein
LLDPDSDSSERGNGKPASDSNEHPFLDHLGELIPTFLQRIGRRQHPSQARDFAVERAVLELVITRDPKRLFDIFSDHLNTSWGP